MRFYENSSASVELQIWQVEGRLTPTANIKMTAHLECQDCHNHELVRATPLSVRLINITDGGDEYLNDLLGNKFRPFFRQLECEACGRVAGMPKADRINLGRKLTRLLKQQLAQASDTADTRPG